MRRTKIVCTIGPASAKREVLTRMLSAGMDVARLNFSHGTHERHAEVISALRELEAKREQPLAILQDLCGPKMRLGLLPGDGIALQRGQVVTLLCAEESAAADALPVPIPELLAALKVGLPVYLDDGRIALKVLEAGGGQARARVSVGGIVSSHKGIAAPGAPIDMPAVTEKDLDDLRFGLAHGVDWVAASFVRRPEDLAPLRRVMDVVGVRVPLVAKIEQAEAVRRIDEMIAAADGILIARGDLGVELPIDEVPGIQKRIARLCRLAGKPVITATQMLDSMMGNPRPTRAEVTDVANAILDGTDAVMLSGETAAGHYPVESVRMMARLARQTDPCVEHRRAFDGSASDTPDDVVARAAVEMARAVRASAIVCATASGSTARRIARFRPEEPVAAVTSSLATYRALALSWGVRPLRVAPVRSADGMMEEAIAAAVAHGLASPGDRIVLTAGLPVNVPGNTNLVRIVEVP